MATIKSSEGMAFGTGGGTHQLEMSLAANGNEFSPTSPRNHCDSHNKDPVMHVELLGNLEQRCVSELGLEYQIHHHPCPILSLDSYI